MNSIETGPRSHYPAPVRSADKGIPHVVQVSQWNRQTAERAGNILAHEHDLGKLPADVAEQIDKFEAGIIRLRTHVSNPDNYPAHAINISRLYKEADQEPSTTMEERVANRLSKFSMPPQVGSDADGTISMLKTEDGSHPVHSLDLSQLTGEHTSYLTIVVPGSEILEAELQRLGRSHFAEAYVRTLHAIYQGSYDVARRGGQHIKMRRGVNDFFGYAREKGIKVSMVSANFMPVVEGMLDQIPNAENIDVWAVTEDSIISTDKGSMLAHLAQTNPDNPLIYIGDGASDEPAIEPQARERVACYFALEGSEFEKLLIREGLPYFPYVTFSDISDKLEEIRNLQLSAAA